MSGYVKSLKITSIENQLDSHNNNKRKTDKTIGYRIILICYVIIMRCKKRYNNEDIRDMRLPINRPGDSHCPAGIFKNIISNVTKNEEAGHGLSPVPCSSLVLVCSWGYFLQTK